MAVIDMIFDPSRHLKMVSEAAYISDTAEVSVFQLVRSGRGLTRWVKSTNRGWNDWLDVQS
jgi:hypothetical protein